MTEPTARGAQVPVGRLADEGALAVFAAVENTVTAANDCYLALTGYSRGELDSGAIRWRELTDPQFAHLDDQALAEIRSTGRCAPYVKQLRRRDGRRPLVCVGGVRLQRDPFSWVAFVLELLADAYVDALSTAVLSLGEVAAASGTPDEMLATVAHEIRTPLAALCGYAEVANLRLGREPLDLAAVQRPLISIRRLGMRMNTLVGTLLDVPLLQGGGQPLVRRMTNVAALVRDTVAELWEPDTQQQIVVHAPTELWATIDATRIDQVLVNLVSNALRYGAGNGPVEVSVRAVGIKPAPGANSADGRTQPSAGKTEPNVVPRRSVRISVRDHGAGIPPERRGAIFERYARARDSTVGLGLGLYISKRIVDEHGGRLSAEFPPDGGTRMVVTLPLDGAVAAPPLAAPGHAA